MASASQTLINVRITKGTHLKIQFLLSRSNLPGLVFDILNEMNLMNLMTNQLWTVRSNADSEAENIFNHQPAEKQNSWL